MPDELRLRENVDGHDWAFVVEGGHGAPRLVCGFGEEGCDEERDPDRPGEPPSPEDARRIEMCWDMHDELVDLAKEFRKELVSAWEGPHGLIGQAQDFAGRIDAVLTRIKCPVTPNPEETSSETEE